VKRRGREQGVGCSERELGIECREQGLEGMPMIVRVVLRCTR